MYKRAMLRWGQCLYAITVEFALKITMYLSKYIIYLY